MLRSGSNNWMKSCNHLVKAPLFTVYKISLSIRRSLLIEFDGLLNKNSSERLFHSPLESRSLLVEYSTQNNCNESIACRRCSSLCGSDPLRNTVSKNYNYSNEIYRSWGKQRELPSTSPSRQGQFLRCPVVLNIRKHCLSYIGCDAWSKKKQFYDTKDKM